jgi:hypothetical protein
MTTTFPLALDALLNPGSNDDLDSSTFGLKHSVQHGNANDSIEAIQAYLGVTGSVVTTSITYQLNQAVANVAAHIASTAAHGATGAVVGTTNAQTLTNKSLDGGSNTFTNIPESGVSGLVADLAKWAPIYVVKASNQTVVNTTTQVNDTDIVFTLPANQTYHIDANLCYQDTVTNFGVQVSWVVTGTIVGVNRVLIGVSPNGSSGSPSAVTISQSLGNASFGGSAIYAGTTINSTYLSHEELIVTTGASGGTLQMKFACGFAGTNTVTMMAGTFAVARRVA